ncbi:DUF4468 domain-containing protein [bacterium]|nr:DUF4468 domain-containing protein [bacterium]
MKKILILLALSFIFVGCSVPQEVSREKIETPYRLSINSLDKSKSFDLVKEWIIMNFRHNGYSIQYENRDTNTLIAKTKYLVNCPHVFIEKCSYSFSMKAEIESDEIVISIADVIFHYSEEESFQNKKDNCDSEDRKHDINHSKYHNHNCNSKPILEKKQQRLTESEYSHYDETINKLLESLSDYLNKDKN